MGKRFKILLVFMSLSLTLSLMSNTYSRYVAGTSSDVQIEFAKWQILVNETDITNNTSSSIVLKPVVEENEFIKQNTIAPSSKGYFDIDIDPTNVDVSFDYEIKLQVLNENIPDLMITKYSILDSKYNEGDALEINNIENSTITGSLNFDNKTENFKFEPFTIRIYFEWFEGESEQMNDEADSKVGNEAVTSDTNLDIKAEINFAQKKA